MVNTMPNWNFNHRTARVNGVNIHYVIEGDGFPVILLHGWPEMWFSWRKQIPVLSQHYQVIVPDMRGFGASEKPLHDYRTRTAATDIYELARHLGHDRVAIVGHDIGVRVSYRYCLDHESEVDRLALLDGTHPLEQLGPQTPAGVRERWHSYFHQIPDLAEHLVRGNEEAYLRHFYRNWSVNQAMMSDEEVAVYATAYSQPGALRGGFSYYRAAAYEDPPDWRADADRVLDIPVLYLWGERRQRTSSANNQDPEESWKRAASNLRTQFIPGGGHFLHEEKPDEVNAALLAFLGEIGS